MEELMEKTYAKNCSNYALLKAAIENSNGYENDATAVIIKTFYVDDLLKSVEDQKYAIDLIRKIQNMCSSGGFNLTEFISNNKLILMSNRENHWREGVKDANLVNKELPTEKNLKSALECRKRPALLQAEIDGRNIARRGMISTFSSFYDHLRLASPFILRGRKIFQYLFQDGQRCHKDVKKIGMPEK